MRYDWAVNRSGIMRFFGSVPRGTWLVAICGLIYLGHAALYGTWINDDAGISFTYARNLAHGHGLVLNPGGERVEGYSNPLWVLLLGPFFFAGLFHPVWTVKALAVLTGLGTHWLMYRLTVLVFGLPDSPTHAAAPLLLATNVSFVTWSVSGLENGLFALLLVGSMVRLLIELGDPGRLPFSAVLLFLLAITRPEGILYFAVALGYRILFSALRLRVTWRDAGWLLVFLVPFAAYHAWHYSYFADIFPNTYYAKQVAGSPEARLRTELLDLESVGWRYVRAARDEYALGYPLAAAVAIVLIGLRRTSAAPLLMIGSLAASVFYAVYVRGDWMTQYRFLTTAFCLVYLIIGGALLNLSAWLGVFPPFVRAPVARNVLVSLVALVCLVTLVRPSVRFLSAQEHIPPVRFASVAARGIQFGDLSRRLGLEDSSLLDPDLGGTSYSSGLRMIDLGGLADVHFATHHYDRRFLGRYVFDERKPTFIHTHCVWSRRSRLHDYHRLQTDYIPLWESPCEDSCCPDSLNGEYVRKDVFVPPDAPIWHRLGSPFGDVRLVGYSAAPDVASPGHPLTLDTYWTAAGPGRAGLTIGAALAGPDGRSHPLAHRPFGHGIYPASDWPEGEIVRERHIFRIPPDAIEGEYSLEIAVGNGNEDPDGSTIGVISVDSGKAREAGRTHLDRARQAIARSDPWEALASFAAARLAIPPDETILAGVKEKIDALIADHVTASLSADDLETASRLLEESSASMGRNDGLERPRRELSRRWYRKGQELLEEDDAFLHWTAAFDSFQRALASWPANSFARKRMEELRVKVFIWERHGSSILLSHEGLADHRQTVELFHRLQDQGYADEAMEILEASRPMRDLLAGVRTLPALALLNNACLEGGAAEECRDLLVEARALAGEDAVLGGKLRFLEFEIEVEEGGMTRMTFWFEVLDPMQIDYKVFLHGYVDDPAILPEERRRYGFANFDHYPSPPTSTWRPGRIIRHTHRFQAAPGVYDLRFGFFSSAADASLLVEGTQSPAVLIGRNHLGASGDANGGDGAP